jgi:hypothetical protein
MESNQLGWLAGCGKSPKPLMVLTAPPVYADLDKRPGKILYYSDWRFPVVGIVYALQMTSYSFELNI